MCAGRPGLRSGLAQHRHFAVVGVVAVVVGCRRRRCRRGRRRRRLWPHFDPQFRQLPVLQLQLLINHNVVVQMQLMLLLLAVDSILRMHERVDFVDVYDGAVGGRFVRFVGEFPVDG